MNLISKSLFSFKNILIELLLDPATLFFAMARKENEKIIKE